MSRLRVFLDSFRELRDEYNSNPVAQKLLNMAAMLDGVVRNARVDATGILITDRDITDYCPLVVLNGEVTTQYEMKSLKKLGLCPINLYHHETLSLIKNTADAVKKTRGIDIDIESVPLDDRPTFSMLSRGDVKGILLPESGDFSSFLSRLKPDSFEDFIAAITLFPSCFFGPLISVKQRGALVTYLHPKMEPILKETYGRIRYREQVWALARDLARFTPLQGYLMWSAMARHDSGITDEYGKLFIDRVAVEMGHYIAKKIYYAEIEPCSHFTFSKSHCTFSALIAYQAAYLKCHYPEEYASALPDEPS
jgi:DNA polymerase-3 subunit alpha